VNQRRVKRVCCPQVRIPPQTIYGCSIPVLSVDGGWQKFSLNVHFPVNFRAISRRRKKATWDKALPTAKIEILGPDSPPERPFSVVFFFFWVSTSTTRSVYSWFPNYPRCTQKAKVHEQGNCLSCKVTQSDLALDFSPRSHSCIWSITQLQPSISQLHLITLLQSSISDNLQGIRKRTDKELCKLKMHVIHEVVRWKNLYYFYWVKQSRTSQSWHNCIQVEVISKPSINHTLHVWLRLRVHVYE